MALVVGFVNDKEAVLVAELIEVGFGLLYGLSRVDRGASRISRIFDSDADAIFFLSLSVLRRTARISPITFL